MSRTVHCRKYNQVLPGLAFPPMPGAQGQELYDTVSDRAWQEWKMHQTMLINEKHLNLLNPEHRKFLQDEMEKFLNNESFEQVEGYVPVEAK